MGRRIDVDNLVTADQIAERLNVADLSVVYNWARRHKTFPAPVLERGKRIRMWDWPEVKEWATEHGYPKPAPPRHN